jgi:hypothetical protein
LVPITLHPLRSGQMNDPSATRTTTGSSCSSAAKLPGQALAVAIAMPANFIGNRLWTFGR